MKKILAKIKKPLPHLLTIPTIPQISATTPFSRMFEIIAGWVLWIAGALALIYLIYGGIIYITAAGNEEKTKAGKSALLSAIIGLVIIALAYAIIKWVAYILQTPKL